MTIDNLSLADKVAIVTGSGREFKTGAAIAIALARNGVAVTINYVSESSAESAAGVAKKIQDEGGKAIVVKALVDEEGAKLLAFETLNAFDSDHIDILVNNSGVVFGGSTLDMPIEHIKEVFDVNVYGAIFMVRAVVPHMPPGGRIINITSICSKLGLAMMTIYGASKAAVDNLSSVWADEFGKSRGVTVNSIAPGPVLTHDRFDLEASKKRLAAWGDKTKAADRLGAVEDVADAVLLLTSEKSRWITGQYISVSGGVTTM